MGPSKPIQSPLPLIPQAAGSKPPVAGNGVLELIKTLPTFSFVKPGEDAAPLLPAADSRSSHWMVWPPAPALTNASALRHFKWPDSDSYRRDHYQFVSLPTPSIIFLPPLGSHPDYDRPSDHNPPMVGLPPTGKKTDVYPGMQVGIARAMEGLPDDLFLAKSYFLRDSSWGATPARVRDFIASPLGQEALEEIRDPALTISTIRCNLRFLEAWLKFRFPEWSDEKLGEFLAERGFNRESVQAKWIADRFGTGAVGTNLAVFFKVPFPNQNK